MDQFDRVAVVAIQCGGVYGLNLLGQLQYVVDQLKVLLIVRSYTLEIPKSLN